MAEIRFREEDQETVDAACLGLWLWQRIHKPNRNLGTVAVTLRGRDTEHLYTEATNNIVQQYGKTYDWSIKVQLMGLTGVEAAKRLVEILDLPITWEDYYAQALEQYKILMPNARLMPDTEGVYVRVISNIAKQYGKQYTPEVRAKVLGTPEKDTATIAVREMKLPLTSDEFLHKFRTESNKYLGSCPFMPGAEKLIKHLHKNKVPFALATSSTKESFDLKTAKYQDFFNLFHHKVTGGSDPEVLHGKPSPDIFLVCAKRFDDKPKPEQCLVFEDAPNGVTAAISAGMQCVMVPDQHIAPELCRHATQVLKSLEDIKLEYFGLPGYVSNT